MDRILRVFVLFSLVVATGPLHADDALARKYADEVISALNADLDRLQSMHSPQQAEIDRLRLQVLNARLLAAQLRGDKAQQQTLQRNLLQNEIEAHSRDLDRLQQQAKRGYAGFPKLRIARLKLLIAKQKAAEHSGDKLSVSKTIDAAVVIEAEHLAVLQQQVSRGYAPTSKIIDQKLRIAQMIADQRVTLPKPGS
jgi:hypothetical protein